MKVKKVNRYYCDYCKKSGGSAGAMAKHEKHCTMNPNRVCRLCYRLEIPQVEMWRLLEILPPPKDYTDNTIDEIITFVDGYSGVVNLAIKVLRDETNNCPMCIFAALRQKGIPVPVANTFDYKKELDNFWADENDREKYVQEMSNLYGGE